MEGVRFRKTKDEERDIGAERRGVLAVKRVACVVGGRVWGFGRRADGGMVSVREEEERTSGMRRERKNGSMEERCIFGGGVDGVGAQELESRTLYVCRRFRDYRTTGAVTCKLFYEATLVV